MGQEFRVESTTPRHRAGLQALDYFLWALQRYYERGEKWYLASIWPKVGEIHDLDRIEEGRVGVIYGKNRPMVDLG